MRVLLIKTSSMGDVIHTLPALTDASLAIPGIKFDWMVEEGFTDIPAWHPAVYQVIPIAWRRWRKQLLSAQTRAEWRHLWQQVHAYDYDLILDAQGLVKSAFFTLMAKGKRAGLDWSSAREALASLVYQKRYEVNFYQHAVVRMRALFSKALAYDLADTAPQFGIAREKFLQTQVAEKYLVFLHGTMWATKQWPESYWVELANIAMQAGYRIKISGGNDEEVARAWRIASACPAVDVMPRLSINQMADLLANAQGAVAVDTGFGHLAAALNVPTVSIYGPTKAEYTGALGDHSLHLSAQFPCAPCMSRVCTYKQPTSVTPACYQTVPPLLVWSTLSKII